jgi:aerobic C4-dicarboxylate transport protein
MGSGTTKAARKPFYANLTVQVLFGVAVGVALGYFAPQTAADFKPLSDGFIKLIKLVIAPVVFLTVVTGIVGIGNMSKVGKVGIKALVYFEIVSTMALVIGLVVVNVIKPGAGLTPPTAGLDKVKTYAEAGQHQTIVEFILTKVIPDSIVGPFVTGELLQVLFLALLFGAAIAALGEVGQKINAVLTIIMETVFKVIFMVMRLAPLGAFGAMAYTISTYGVSSLTQLGSLLASVYITAFAFVFIVLAIIARLFGFSIFKFVRYIGNELLLVLGTSSSETALPLMLSKMQRFGCSKAVTGLVLPTGYSFNLDGTSIYLSMAAIFIAQAYNIDLSIGQQIGILLVLLLTSKGAAAVTGGGFVTLAATLSATHALPVEGLALLFGVDRFMSEIRALTNLVGNGVATVVVAKLEGEFDEKMALAEYQEHFHNPAIAKI